MNIEIKRIKEMYEFMNNTSSPLQPSNGAFVFCRDDPSVAKTAADLLKKKLVDYILFVGGIGKDSGYLTPLQLPEAKWQAALCHYLHSIDNNKIYIEGTATHGGECSRKGLDTLVLNNLQHDSLTVVCHPTQLRRVVGVLENEGNKRGLNVTYQQKGTDYLFNPQNPTDQREVVYEILCLADWPAKGWCTEQSELSTDLIKYARHLKKQWAI